MKKRSSKIIFASLGALTSISAVSVGLVSCGKNTTPSGDKLIPETTLTPATLIFSSAKLEIPFQTELVHHLPVGTLWSLSDIIVTNVKNNPLIVRGNPIGIKSADVFAIVTIAGIQKQTTAKVTFNSSTNQYHIYDLKINWAPISEPTTAQTTLHKIGNSDFSNMSTFSKIDDIYYAGGNQGLWTSQDGMNFSKNAIPVLGDHNGDGWVSFVKKINNVIFLGEDGFGPQATYQLNSSGADASFGLWTSNDGQKFTQNNSFPKNIGVYSLQKINNIYYLGADNGLYTSNDGITWKIVNSVDHKTGNTIGNAGIVAINKQNIIVGSGYFGHGLWESNNNGQSFSAVDIKNGISKDASIHKVTKIGKTVYVCVDRWGSKTLPGLYKSTDNGQSFTPAFQLAEDDSVNDIVKINNTLYVSTTKGLYISNDNGKTFKISKTINANYVVNHISVFNNWLYAATKSGLFVAIVGTNRFEQSITLKDQGPMDLISVIDDRIFIDYKSVGVYTN